MTNDITALIDFYEREKELPREKVVNALEHAFVSAYRKMVPNGDRIKNLFCSLEMSKGGVTIYAELRAVAEGSVEDPYNEVALNLAKKISKNEDLVEGEFVRANVTPKEFGRIAIQTARQAMLQRLRDAEKELLVDEFKDRVGELIRGTVARFEKGDCIVTLGRYEGVMPPRERNQSEDYAVGDILRFYIVDVRDGNRGPEVVLSRSHPNLVRRLFESEVSEIADKTVEIKGIAREAGYRTKVAVISNDPKVDPQGACIGVRGIRVKNIVRELNGEKVDIVEWHDDPAEFVRGALDPVVPMEVIVDEEKHRVNVVVEDEKELAKAIGRRGQNARLTARLMGWELQVRAYDPKVEQARQASMAADALSVQLSIPNEQAVALVGMGGTSADVIAEMEPSDIAEVIGVTEEDACSIIESAKKANA